MMPLKLHEFETLQWIQEREHVGASVILCELPNERARDFIARVSGPTDALVSITYPQKIETERAHYGCLRLTERGRSQVRMTPIAPGPAIEPVPTAETPIMGNESYTRELERALARLNALASSRGWYRDPDDDLWYTEINTDDGYCTLNELADALIKRGPARLKERGGGHAHG
jgi:hypothetical protein